MEQWFDILSPEVPAGMSVDMFDLALYFFLATAIIFILFKRINFIKALFILIKLWIYRRLALISNKDLACELGYLLSLALQVPQLKKSRQFPQQEQWVSFLADLDRARYNSKTPSKSETDELLALTGYWLMQAVRLKLMGRFRWHKAEKPERS